MQTMGMNKWEHLYETDIHAQKNKLHNLNGEEKEHNQ
uniref:Uncharacterized protein n=1 Tax=Rhizophora mucronata TaxID=61149 RepID=A0A2P2NC34_RHIMU